MFPIDWSAFHFLRPQLLWLLGPVLLIFLLGMVSLRQEVKWKSIIAPHLRPYVIQKGSQHKKIFMYGVMLLGMVCGVLGLAGPTWKKIEVPGQILETPVMVILDMSESMLSDDIQPSRIERAKFKLNDFLTANPRARVALVGFAGTAHTIVPLTSDYQVVRSHLDGLMPSMMPEPGNNLTEALQLADSVMSVTDAPGKIVVLSDDDANELLPEFQQYVQYSDNQIILLPMRADTFNLFQRNSTEKIIQYPLTLDNSDVEAIASAIRRDLEFTEAPEEKDNQWRDAGWMLVIPFAGMLLFWFQRGWVLMSMLLFFSSCSDQQHFRDLWYTKDYQGQQLSNKGEFEKAARTYTEPLRQGIAYYQAGDYKEAAQAFSRDTTAFGQYNKGLAYTQMGDLRSAKIAFDQAVEMNPDFQPAVENQQKVTQIMQSQDEVSLDDAEEEQPSNSQAENKQNDSPEDLSGGGQEATEEDMKKERLEETVATDIRKGKELDEVPDDIGASEQQEGSKVLMQKVDDDPTLFLKRKFAYQLKRRKEAEK